MSSATSTKKPKAKSGTTITVRVAQDRLARALTQVAGTVAKSTTLEALGHAHLSFEGATLSLTTTNMQAATRVTIGVERVERVDGARDDDAALCVPALLLKDFVATLPASVPVSLEVNTETFALKVRGGNQQATLHGTTTQDFPHISADDALAGLDAAETVTLDASEWRAVYKSVGFAAAQDDARPTFTGVLLRTQDAADGGTEFVGAAADSVRVAVREAPLSAPSRFGRGLAGGLDVLVPVKSLTLFHALLATLEGPVTVGLVNGGNQIMWVGDGIHFVASLLADGRFPNYRGVVPTTFMTRVTVEREALIKAAKSVSLFAKSDSQVVRFSFTPGGSGGGSDALLLGSMRIALVRATQNGDAEASLDADVEGEACAVMLNIGYVLAQVAVFDATRVTLTVKAPTAPVLISPVATDDPQSSAHAFGVLAPMTPKKSED